MIDPKHTTVFNGIEIIGSDMVPDGEIWFGDLSDLRIKFDDTWVRNLDDYYDRKVVIETSCDCFIKVKI